MKADAMRNMIKDVLHVLYLKGLYTPVVSYDGQWAVLSYRANDGTPLTLLELQNMVKREPEAYKAEFEQVRLPLQGSLLLPCVCGSTACGAQNTVHTQGTLHVLGCSWLVSIICL